MVQTEIEKIERAGYTLLEIKKNCYNSSKFPPCNTVGVFCGKTTSDGNYSILYVDMENGYLLRQASYTEEDIEVVGLILREY